MPPKGSGRISNSEEPDKTALGLHCPKFRLVSVCYFSSTINLVLKICRFFQLLRLEVWLDSVSPQTLEDSCSYFCSVLFYYFFCILLFLQFSIIYHQVKLGNYFEIYKKQ